ncbi:hypothetical protein HDU96_005174 [Phlyctochytrium bullatum]|nr:hypothetical protein HDU96_005174 [Phlyctochytrium bullatum]
MENSILLEDRNALKKKGAQLEMENSILLEDMNALKQKGAELEVENSILKEQLTKQKLDAEAKNNSYVEEVESLRSQMGILIAELSGLKDMVSENDDLKTKLEDAHFKIQKLEKVSNDVVFYKSELELEKERMKTLLEEREKSAAKPNPVVFFEQITQTEESRDPDTREHTAAVDTRIRKLFQVSRRGKIPSESEHGNKANTVDDENTLEKHYFQTRKALEEERVCHYFVKQELEVLQSKLEFIQNFNGEQKRRAITRLNELEFIKTSHDLDQESARTLPTESGEKSSLPDAFIREIELIRKALDCIASEKNEKECTLPHCENPSTAESGIADLLTMMRADICQEITQVIESFGSSITSSISTAFDSDKLSDEISRRVVCGVNEAMPLEAVKEKIAQMHDIQKEHRELCKVQTEQTSKLELVSEKIKDTCSVFRSELNQTLQERDTLNAKYKQLQTEVAELHRALSELEKERAEVSLMKEECTNLEELNARLEELNAKLKFDLQTALSKYETLVVESDDLKEQLTAKECDRQSLLQRVSVLETTLSHKPQLSVEAVNSMQAELHASRRRCTELENALEQAGQRLASVTGIKLALETKVAEMLSHRERLAKQNEDLQDTLFSLTESKLQADRDLQAAIARAAETASNVKIREVSNAGVQAGSEEICVNVEREVVEEKAICESPESLTPVNSAFLQDNDLASSNAMYHLEGTLRAAEADLSVAMECLSTVATFLGLSDSGRIENTTSSGLSVRQRVEAITEVILQRLRSQRGRMLELETLIKERDEFITEILQSAKKVWEERKDNITEFERLEALVKRLQFVIEDSASVIGRKRIQRLVASALRTNQNE